MRSWAAQETEPAPEGGSRGAWPLPALGFPKHLCAAGPAAEGTTLPASVPPFTAGRCPVGRWHSEALSGVPGA